LFRRVGGVNVITYPQFVELVTPAEPTPSYIASNARLAASSRGFRSTNSKKLFTSNQDFLTRQIKQEISLLDMLLIDYRKVNLMIFILL